VGSDLDTLVIRELARRGVPRVLGINPALSHEAAAAATATLPEGSELRSVDLLRAGFTEHSFGAIFSVAVFEHLNDFDACLREMYRLLVPGGRVYAAFGPIWSSSLGHHVFADRGNIQLRHWDPKLNPVDDHAHLLLERNEMAAGIAKSRGPVVAEAAAEWIYDSTDVNRLFYDDYVAAFQRSPLTLVRITPEREHVPADRLQRLRAKHPRQGTFDVRNAEVVLERPR
jgi:SAM-dependent methyltransferase